MTAMTTTSERRETGLSRELLVLGAVVVLGTIMSILDVTIVNVAIPTLGSDFHTSISTIQWVMTGYLLSFASVIPLTGWATERFGAKRVWLVSLLLFMLGSVLSGFAWSIGSLVGFRAVVLAQRLLPDAKPQLGQRLDLRGLALLSPGIAVFLYGMSEAGNQGGFSEPRTIVAALLG